MFCRRILSRGLIELCQSTGKSNIINKRPLTFSIARNTSSPNDTYSKQGSYEGPGCTTVTILNQEMTHVNLIDSYALDGFRLNDSTKILGPCIIFPNAVLSWKVSEPKDITDESLAIFQLLHPKMDIIVVGHGARSEVRDPVDPRVILGMKKKGIAMEVLSTENAVSTYNFLIQEGRLAAAALIPPGYVTFTQDQVVESRAELGSAFSDGNTNYLGMSRAERRIAYRPGENAMDATEEVRQLRFRIQDGKRSRK